VQGSTKCVDGIERIGDKEQIGRLEARSLGGALDLRPDIPCAANCQVRLLAEQLKRLARDIQQVCDLN
jgi:hypothetical protein